MNISRDLVDMYVTESVFDSVCRASHESTSLCVHLLTYSWIPFLVSVLVCDKIESIGIYSHQFVFESSETYALRLEFVYLPIVYALLPILSRLAGCSASALDKFGYNTCGRMSYWTDRYAYLYCGRNRPRHVHASIGDNMPHRSQIALKIFAAEVGNV